MLAVSIKNNIFSSNSNKTILIDESGSCSSLNDDFCFSDEMFEKLLSRDNGFLLVVFNDNQVFFSVDRIRSYPLYYAIENQKLFVSDSANWIKEKLENREINDYAAIEFRQAGFVTGSKTLYINIFTLQAGEYIYAINRTGKWETNRKRYFEYYSKNRINKPSNDLYKEMDDIFHATFSSLIQKNRDKTLVVPLSGGLDSRLIVHWLKRLGCANVLCYSFGALNNNDCKAARQTASKLKYKWRFVNLSTELWNEAYQSELYQDLKKSFSGYCSLMCSQEFPAFYSLVKERAIPENSVIIPGHTGDFISGGHIPLNIYDYHLSLESVEEFILQKHFMLWKTLKFRYRRSELNYIKDRIKRQMKKHKLSSPEDIAQIIELYDWQERQAKLIVQFVSVYKLFEYPFELPLWSKDIISFFLKIPLELRLGKILYKKYLKEYDEFGLFEDIKLFNDQNKNRLKENSIRSFLRSVKVSIYNEWFYKAFFAYFKDDLNFYAPFSYVRLPLNLGMFRNQNSFFTRDYLSDINDGKL
jgi:asparagine synthase (glutamine-hydrolysing)